MSASPAVRVGQPSLAARMRGWFGAAPQAGVVADVRYPAEVLLGTWRQASLDDGWLGARDWWHPACDAVVEALLAERSPTAAMHRLGQARGGLGCGVEETIDDVAALWRVHAGHEPPLSATRALAAGWAEASLQAVGEESCVDAGSGLSTRGYLEARLGELYRDARPGHPADDLAIVVIDIGGPTGLAGVGAMARVVEVLRRTFTGGETMARLAPGRAVVLCPDDKLLGARLAELSGLLRNPELVDDLCAAIWTETLPRTAEHVRSLLLDLSR